MARFLIKSSDIERLKDFFESSASDFSEEVDACKASITDFINLPESDFSGEAADNIKAYMSEVHLTMLNAAKQISNLFATEFKSYADKYAAIDTADSFTLPDSEMEEFKEALKKEADTAYDICAEANRVLNDISDIVPCGTVTSVNIRHATDSVVRDVSNLQEDIMSIESDTMTNLDKLEKYIEAFEKCVEEIGAKGWTKPENYTSGDFFKNPNYINMKNVKAEITDPRGEKVAGVSESFIEIVDGNRVRYGGDQDWFEDWIKEYGINVKGMGCGIIAAVNEYLYLTGQTHVTKEYYMSLVEEYLKQYPLTVALLDEPFSLGALPWNIASFVEHMCKKDGVEVKVGWNGINGTENNYELMTEMLKNGIPVIWSLYDNNKDDGDSYYLYEFDSKSGTYQKNGEYCDGHFVTVTAIFETEDGRRMVEVSSYGEIRYVDYDEYLQVLSDTGITDIINNYFSNIVKVEVK